MTPLVDDSMVDNEGIMEPNAPSSSGTDGGEVPGLEPSHSENHVGSGAELRHPELPHPENFPDRNILIYDGDCKFCLSQVTKLAQWDTDGVLAFVPLQHPLVAERFPDLTHDMLMKEMFLVTTDGNKHGGNKHGGNKHDGNKHGGNKHGGNKHGGVNALRELSKRLPRLKWLAFWFRIPLAIFVTRMVYRTIAKFRYRLWGKVNRCDHGTCELHF